MPGSLNTPVQTRAVSARPCAPARTCGTLVSAAGLAQLVEQLSCKQQVIGSSPISGSTYSAVKLHFWSYMAAYSRVGTLKAPLKFCIAACETPALFKRAPKYPVNKAQFFELRMLYARSHHERPW